MIKTHLKTNFEASGNEIETKALDNLANEEEHSVLKECTKLISYRTAVLKKVTKVYIFITQADLSYCEVQFF